MIGTELIINFENNKAYLTNTIYLPFEQVEVGDFFDKATYAGSWKVKVQHYNSNDKRIFAEIISYNSYRQPFPLYQLAYEQELSQIEKIGFRNIDTTAVFKTLKAEKTKATFFSSSVVIPTTVTPTDSYEVLPKVVKESISLPLDNIHFRSGYVSFETKIGHLKNPLEFRVNNHHIREEFDAIKDYFGNVLKAKKFQFNITATITDQEITDVQVFSDNVNSIDDKLIENVKQEIVKRIIDKKFEDESLKTLLTMDDLFAALTENKVKAEIFFEDEKSLLNDILDISGTKHYRHLRFLSDIHCVSVMKLRFTVKPFSFIFLIQGKNKYYIVWETLNTTEATYIWHLEKDIAALKSQLQKVDDIIKGIKAFSKTDYISKAEKNFSRISHDYSDPNAGFVKWREKIEKAIA